MEIEEVNSRRQREYENRLAECLQQIRDENKVIIQRNRDEVGAVYEKKVCNNFQRCFVLFLCCHKFLVFKHCNIMHLVIK